MQSPPCKTHPCMKDVISAALEAKLAGVFYNGKEVYPICTCLAELGHPLTAPIPMKTDNTTAKGGFANDTAKQKHSKAIDMRFYWIHDRVKQGQYHVIGTRPNSTAWTSTSPNTTLLTNIINVCGMRGIDIKATLHTSKIIMKLSVCPTVTPMSPSHTPTTTSHPSSPDQSLRHLTGLSPD